jgi:hypothetical protein
MWFLRKPERRLKNILIYPRFQLGLIIGQAAFMTVAFIAVQVMNFFSFRAMTAIGRDAGIGEHHYYFNFIAAQSNAFFWRTLAVFVVLLLASSICTLILSFRLAGPIFRLRKYLRLLADQGEAAISPLRFRDGDFYADLPPALNEAVERLQNGARPGTAR